MDDVRICTHRPLWTNLSCQRVWDWKMSRMKLWLSCVLLYSCMWCWTTSASSSCSGALLQKYFGYQFSGREYVSPQIFSLFSWVTILFLETVIFCSDSFGMSCLEVPGIKHILEVSSHRTWAQICPCFSIKGSVFFCGGWPCFVGHPPLFLTPWGTLRPPPQGVGGEVGAGYPALKTQNEALHLWALGLVLQRILQVLSGHQGCAFNSAFFL